MVLVMQSHVEENTAHTLDLKNQVCNFRNRDNIFMQEQNVPMKKID